MGEGGLEPPRGFPHWHLKPARLPFRHSPEWKRQRYHGTSPPTADGPLAAEPASPAAGRCRCVGERPSRSPLDGHASHWNGAWSVWSRACSPWLAHAIRPIELGRRLVREMDDQRSVDVKGRRVVPNDFTVLLAPKDYDGFAEIDDVLRTELVEAAREYARGEGYHFMGPVTSSCRSTSAEARPLRVHRLAAPSGRGRRAERPGSLVMPSGERIALADAPVTVGRLSECTIAAQRPERQPPPRRDPPLRERFVIIDLGLDQRHDRQWRRGSTARRRSATATSSLSARPTSVSRRPDPRPAGSPDHPAPCARPRPRHPQARPAGCSTSSSRASCGRCGRRCAPTGGVVASHTVNGSETRAAPVPSRAKAPKGRGAAASGDW